MKEDVHNTTEYFGEFESIRANPKQKVFKNVCLEVCVAM
jgi:hypothetical protein